MTELSGIPNTAVAVVIETVGIQVILPRINKYNSLNFRKFVSFSTLVMK